MEAGRHAARQMRRRNRALADVGRLKHTEVAAALLGNELHTQDPAIAFGGFVRSRHEDRLAKAVVGIAAEGRAGAGLEVVVGEAVTAGTLSLGIGDVARDDPAMPVGAHAVAFVEAREFAGAFVELFLAEGVGLARET